jgi:hypothetical protein
VVALDGQHKFFRFRIPTSVYGDSHLFTLAAELLTAGDVVIAISNSGKLPELLQAVETSVLSGVLPFLLGVQCDGDDPKCDPAPIAGRVRVHRFGECTNEMTADCEAVVAADQHVVDGDAVWFVPVAQVVQQLLGQSFRFVTFEHQAPPCGPAAQVCARRSRELREGVRHSSDNC